MGTLKQARLRGLAQKTAFSKRTFSGLIQGTPGRYPTGWQASPWPRLPRRPNQIGASVSPAKKLFTSSQDLKVAGLHSHCLRGFSGHCHICPLCPTGCVLLPTWLVERVASPVISACPAGWHEGQGWNRVLHFLLPRAASHPGLLQALHRWEVGRDHTLK